MKTTKQKQQENEKGAALLAALFLVIILALMTASISFISQNTQLDSYASVQTQKATYIAEGVAERIKWVIMMRKRKKLNTIKNAQTLDLDKQESDNLFFIQHGFQSINYYGTTVRVNISELNTGITITDARTVRNLNTFKNLYKMEPEKIEQLNAFTAKLQDYIDSDSAEHINGLEHDGYSSELPRNASLQFREELFWIPGSKQFINIHDGSMTNINTIALPYMRKINNTKRNLYSITKTDMKQLTLWDDSTIETIFEVIEQNGNLKEELPYDLYRKLIAKFTTAESGFYTITVQPLTKQNGIQRTLKESLYIPTYLPLYGIRYYNYLSY